MIMISPHGQIFLNYLSGVYMAITVPWHRGMRDLSQNYVLSKRTPIIKELCSGFWSIFGHYYLKISLPSARFRFLTLVKIKHRSIMERF